ncbi:hypothetical protein Lepto7375DRAFT_5510 [Leptolyngbya sp. PCC 7375]|nr:hypothetical protein Lepto7375DRAFT_5510 [Leptolyngbya sp. PCC 7375]
MTDTPLDSQRARRLRLRTTLVLPFVLQIVAAVGLVGYVSFWNGQKAVQSLANKLVEEIEDQVAQYLDNYTSVPHQINQVNLDAIDLGILNLEDFDAMGRYFWRQLKVFDVGYINFGNEQEAFIGAERLDDGSLMIHEAPIADVNQFSSYTTDAEGNRLSSNVEPALRKRREDELKRQLEELQIEIDHKKREEEVKSLTSSTYFQEVQEEISDVNLDEFWS